MNTAKVFLLAAVLTAGIGSAKAQAQKSGYISVEQMISLMPELGKIDTALQRYQVDSVNTEFASLIQDYNYKDSLVKGDTSKIPAATLRQYRRDLEATAYQVQNWQQISQQAMQSKQQELLGPVYQRVYAAINQVAKENNYAFVYNQEALLVAPPGDNLLPMVAKKLNVKLPTQPGTAGNTQPRPTTGAARPRS